MPLRVVDTKPTAVKTFETFYDRAPEQEIEMPFGWPTQMQEIGVGGAEMYRSNKWQQDRSEHEDYKHVAEGTRTVYAAPDFLRERNHPERRIQVVGPMVQFEEPMPRHFTRLGPLLGVQVRLYREGKNGELVVPPGNENRFDITVARAWLASAKHPATKETFLFIYAPDGVFMILTGGSLTIGKDGIAG